MKKWIAGAALGAVVLVGCSKATEPYQDAPVGKRNNAPSDIMVMPDGFSNVATKCDGPNRVYTAFHGDDNRAAVAVVAGDPRCVPK